MALTNEQRGARLPSSGWLLGPCYAASLVLIFVGERVVTSDSMRYALSGLGALGAFGATALRFVEASRASGERRAVERSLALLSTLGLVAVGLYFTSTDAAKAALGIAKASPEMRARIEGGTTVTWIALLVIALLPLLFGELALAPMRRAAHVEARRVRSAIAAALSIAFALVYVGLFTYAAGELDAKVDFSYFRTARPSDSTKRIAESSADPIKVTAFFPQLNDVGLEVDGYLRELRSAAPSLKVETYDRLLVPAVAKEAKVSQDGVLVQAGVDRFAAGTGVGAGFHVQQQIWLQVVILDAQRLPHEAVACCKVKFTDPFQDFLAIDTIDATLARSQLRHTQQFVGTRLGIHVCDSCEQAAVRAATGHAVERQSHVRMARQAEMQCDVFVLVLR